MTDYFIGNLLGRLLMSGLLIYVVLLLFNRFSFREALAGLKRPLSLAMILLVFALGLAGSSHAATVSERAKRPFAVTKIPEAGLSVFVPDRPSWNLQVQQRRDASAVILSTPDLYYPPASMELVLNQNLQVKKEELATVALSALNTVREKAGVSSGFTQDQLKAVQYGDIQAYEVQYDFQADGDTYSAKSVMGVMPSGKPITFFLATPKGELKHIEHMADKIWSHLKEL